MIDSIILICAIIWVIGWVREIAHVHTGMEKLNLSYPSTASKYAMPLLLFFTWPYFYFYGKN